MNWWILKRKIHTSWLITIVCFGIVVGIFFAQYIQHSFFSSITTLFIATIIIAIVLCRKYVYLIPFVLIAGILIGLWRGTISQVELARFEPLYKHSITIKGTVKDDVDIGSSNQLVIRLDNLIIKNQSLPGSLWATTADKVDIKRGDKLILHGILEKGFGSFSGAMYRVKIDKVINPQPGDIARIVRDWFAGAVRKIIPSPESDLGIGFLVGQRRALPIDLLSALKIAGLTHIIVASGYNLTILVRLTRKLLSKLSKYLSTLFTSLMILSFIAVTGVSPSMFRAGLVSGLCLLAWYYGRKFHPIVLLLVIAAITLLINPSYAWGDLGWQLSFAAFAGVMILAPLLQKYLFGDREKSSAIRQILLETLSAQILTFPILVASFGQLSNVAIISNLLILPLVPLAMLLTFISGVSSLLLPFFAKFIAFPVTWLLGYMITTINFFANLPWATSKLNLEWWGVLICYVLITGFCVYIWRVTKYNLREANPIE